jgi:Flp pilus assembly pilin Flp
VSTRLFRRLRADARGTTMVEFALIALPMIVTLLGFLDLGYREYMSTQLNGAVAAAVRSATVGNVTTTQVDNIVYQMMAPFAPPSQITITHLSYRQMSGVGKPETLTTDVNGNGRYDPGDCWIDSNPNGVWDADAGLNGLGGSDDVLMYKASVTFPRFLPMARLLGWSANQTVAASTVMREQPYAGHPSPATVCG